MKDQINTIRAALESVTDTADWGTCVKALTALSELESSLTQYEAGDMASAAAQGFRDGVASVTQQEPVAWLYESPMPDGSVFVGASAERLKIGFGVTPDTKESPLYRAAPVAQQPQAKPDIHEAQGQIEFLDRKNNALSAAIRKVMARLADLLDEDQFKEIEETISSAGVQPQAEAVQACGHPMSLLLRSAESNEPLYCEACDDKSGRHDAERRETELLDANRRLQEKIASADALKLHAIEELCQLGYTVKDGELIPPDHLHKLVEAAGHPLAAPQQAEAVPPDVVRDAERYRWLRNESWAGYNTGKGTPSVYTVDGAGNRRMMLAEEAMDDAIDAAIAAQGAKT